MSAKRYDTIVLGLLKKEDECQIAIFLFARCVHKIPLYSDVIHSFDWKSAIERGGGVPNLSYSSVCNVLCQWSISLIPTYRVYRLYDFSVPSILSGVIYFSVLVLLK